MKLSLLLSWTLFISVSFGLYGQTFLNGSFENTTASVGCNYNLVNGTFNALMANTIAYGGGNESDILINGCYTSGIPDGIRAVGLAAPTVDEIALQLSSPLTAGVSYTISFWSYSEVSFRAQGNIQIGASTSSSAFGSSIYIGTTIPSTWVNHVFTFVAPNNATYITVRNVIDGVIHWNHVDHFQMIVPLPTELNDFNARPLENNTAELTWETLSELNNDYFTIERSKNTTDWEDVLSHEGAGNSSSVLHYVDYDHEPYPGISYYRLKQTDFNGNHSYSEIRAVEFDSYADMRLYPNPANQHIVVSGLMNANTSLTIYDAVGNDVMSSVQIITSLENELVLDISRLSSGLYILRTGAHLLKFSKK